MTRTNTRALTIGSRSPAPVAIGPDAPLAIIAGPCLLESLELGLDIGHACKAACERLGVGYVFKASFDKANRSSITSPRGPGLEQGLAWLATIRDELGVPITTDLHEPAQAEPVASTCDLLQIPAFLCRQTDLLVATGIAADKHGRAVNIKKGQFVSPSEMLGPVRKLHQAGCDDALLTDRGTFFGYHRLVTDLIGLGDLLELDCSSFTDLGPPPVCFDATHSAQQPGIGEQSGGYRHRVPQLARAAVALGVHAVFIETHPDPDRAMSDAATQLRLDDFEQLIEQLAAIRRSVPLR